MWTRNVRSFVVTLLATGNMEKGAKVATDFVFAWKAARKRNFVGNLELVLMRECCQSSCHNLPLGSA